MTAARTRKIQKSKLNSELACIYCPYQGEDNEFNTRNRSTHCCQKLHAAMITPAHLAQLNDERNKKGINTSANPLTRIGNIQNRSIENSRNALRACINRKYYAMR